MDIRYVGSDLHQFVHHCHRTERKDSWRNDALLLPTLLHPASQHPPLLSL